MERNCTNRIVLYHSDVSVAYCKCAMDAHNGTSFCVCDTFCNFLYSGCSFWFWWGLQGFMDYCNNLPNYSNHNNNPRVGVWGGTGCYNGVYKKVCTMGCQYLGGIYNSDVITITLKKDSMIVVFNV